MRIGSIEKQRKGNKFKVLFDEGTELLLSKEVIIDFGLRRNDDISAEIFSELRNSQSYRDAYLAAARLLNYRLRTRSELDGRLMQKGFERDTVDKVIRKLSDIGLIDDSRFADAFVASKIASKPVGKRELARGLREKGVGRETAAAAVSLVSDDETQLRLALDAASTRMRSLARFEPVKQREKLSAFLARRGFDWDVIKKVTQAMLKGDKDAVDL